MILNIFLTHYDRIRSLINYLLTENTKLFRNTVKPFVFQNVRNQDEIKAAKEANS